MLVIVFITEFLMIIETMSYTSFLFWKLLNKSQASNICQMRQYLYIELNICSWKTYQGYLTLKNSQHSSSPILKNNTKKFFLNVHIILKLGISIVWLKLHYSIAYVTSSCTSQPTPAFRLIHLCFPFNGPYISHNYLPYPLLNTCYLVLPW